MSFLKRRYHSALKCLIFPIVYICRRLGEFFSNDPVKYSQIEELEGLLSPGDIILTYTRWGVEGIIIPGHWSHCEIYIGDKRSIGAVYPFVRCAWLFDAVSGATEIAVLRIPNLTGEDLQGIIDYAIEQVGKKYDDRLDFLDDDRFSCAELVFGSVNHAMPGYLKLKKRMGYPTITPQDIFEYREGLDLVWRS